MSRSALLSLLLAGLLLASSLSYSNDLSERLLTSAERLPLGADFAAVVKNTADNTSLANINGNKLVPPASTLKAVTALAAYYQLGKDFRFTTQFFYESNGDRVLVFSGDPLLSREDLRKLLMRGKGQGTNRITGDLILDGSIFDGHLWSTAQSWSDRHICFAAPSSAINLNHNCVWARLHIGTLGSTVRAEVPSREPIQIISTARGGLSGRTAAQHVQPRLNP